MKITINLYTCTHVNTCTVPYILNTTNTCTCIYAYRTSTCTVHCNVHVHVHQNKRLINSLHLLLSYSVSVPGPV